MKLTILSVTPSDFGSYKCVSKNSLGDTDGTIKLYPVPRPATNRPKHKGRRLVLLKHIEHHLLHNYYDTLVT
uniref:Immunoglobulin I-set domain-containing protein n=1 Tax=Rhodnius prolixus TaxID=13249 RepID=T1I547_RHOPR